MVDTPRPAPGWYPHPSMAGTQRYWDGAHWTDHIAPVVARPAAVQSGPGALTIARGVALGIAGLIGIIWLIGSFVTADDDTECAIRNAERALGERSGPTEICD